MADQKPSKPFSSERTKLVITKITAIYAAFYFVLKLSAIFNGAWVLPNLVLTLPLLILGLIAWYLLKSEQTNWLFVIVSILIISAIRYYEAEAVVWLNSILQ
ncbi:hypothetical protein [Psychroflexus sp. ALD_RP9]|uniref:hypothetical protein n=1 Tax=Psychroflexus sp. ALD_RP9 TaxID=2777186 RepID=UPI001A907092|nr:hypothetical protein [Psychroflexus sp. ALD_RP9]QSS96467.1 hypothetical protein IMZ30_08405 [Psychroflexus sp. ALD_RP9]